MQYSIEDIDKVRATKTQDFYHVNFENEHDYKKAKWMLSRLPIKSVANDFTKTLYFLGKKL
jgi:hypothetical protein